jgi:lipopolysaccharide export system permease protein
LAQIGEGTGERAFIGIIVGIVFFLANRTANKIGVVYGITPLVSAFFPSLLLLGVGLFVINRIR